ncbi:hypothetical protein P7K49_034877 [Saguinus oedipus]|uniref:Uncharacterized protein n=1 Tax=Saguinus oedipus TaxID=9490 RepID=A0ABQ9TVZ4_SAGOE|nr:hypothetical protein P7K49_034877 [Saguinus oedipus]
MIKVRNSYADGSEPLRLRTAAGELSAVLAVLRPAPRPGRPAPIAVLQQRRAPSSEGAGRN